MEIEPEQQEINNFLSEKYKNIGFPENPKILMVEIMFLYVNKWKKPVPPNYILWKMTMFACIQLNIYTDEELALSMHNDEF